MKTQAAALVALLLCAVPCLAQAPERVPVVLDTDIGTDIDDPFALALLLASPEVDLRGVTTVGADTNVRAMMLCRFLTFTGRRHTPVAAGAGTQPDRPIKNQYQYYYHPDVLFDRTKKPEKATAVEFLYARLKAAPGKVTLLAAGPLTNVAQLFADKPDSKAAVGRIVISGSALAADIKAAQAVLASGVPLVLVRPDVASGLKLSNEDVKKIFAPKTALSLQVECLYQLWDGEKPNIAAAFAAALCFEERFAAFENLTVEIDDKGVMQFTKGKTNARVVMEVKKDEFLKWYVGRMADCVAPAARPAKLIDPGNFPHRVHVAEDYDTDIEKRWWMSGKAETKTLPPGSTRACRGVLTHDFDDLLGNPKAMHTGVVFNPVPGPPMGKNTCLKFRYWLKGTDTLRVQLYSLTNGYHRHLVVTGLEQGAWKEGAVDMTLARRPDGTGGPLSENERIDDIQFYADPAAEIIIDDVVLYDAAETGEKRPFPKHVHFAGVFDTGKQGKEWPGTFEIVEKGYFWKAARSVDNADGNNPGLRINLRGPRPLGEQTKLTFRYRLTGADAIRFGIPADTGTNVLDLKDLKKGEWAQATVDFAGLQKPPRKGDRIDELIFTLPKGAELLLDDLILYEP